MSAYPPSAKAVPKKLPAAVSDQLVYCQRNVNNGYTYMTFGLDGQVDLDRLKRAARLLIDAEPILSCRFVDHWFRPCWRRREDLDELNWVVEFPRDEMDRQLALHTDNRRDPCLDPVFRLLVFRGETDAVSLELCNICSDGSGGLYLFRRLGEIYDRLASDPGFIPHPGRIDDRGYDVLGRVFGWRDRLRILRNVVQNVKRMRAAGRWSFPRPTAGAEQSFLFGITLSSEQVRALSRYGRQHQATVPLLVLTAIYRALKAEFCPAEQAPLPIFMPVSLRSYFPGEFDDIPTHFVGGTILLGAGEADAPFDETLAAFREQFKSRRKNFLGLMSPALLIETIPPLNWLFHLLPYRLIRAQIQRRTRRAQQGAGPGLAVFTCMELNPKSIPFGPHEVTAVSVAGNIPRTAGVAGFAVMRLGDSVTIATSGFENCIEPRRLQNALRRIIDELTMTLQPMSLPVPHSSLSP